MIALSLAVVWDLWHVPMQNFGISRMLSSDVQLKRTSIPLNSRLEKIFHITIYAVPLLLATPAISALISGDLSHLTWQKLVDPHVQYGELVLSAYGSNIGANG